MKRLAFLVLPALMLASSVHAANASPAGQSKQPLRPVITCPDITRISEWHVIDDRTLTLRTGPYRYVMTTQHACQKLGRHGASIRFTPSSGNLAVSMPRMCGDIGELVSSRGQPSCAIESVKMISKQRFDDLTSHARRNGHMTSLHAVAPNKH